LADSAHLRGFTLPNAKLLGLPRHSAFVRFTHWSTAISFLGLLVGGIAILLAHPRLYWGETGSVGAPSIVDLPLPFVLEGQSSWGRSLHFLSAWLCVLTGLLYVIYGLLTRHFRTSLLPGKTDFFLDNITRVISEHLRLKRPMEEDSLRYNILQRLAYLTVVFVFFPVMIATGLAMSPAITSVFPALVSVFGGHQSARTVHFFVALLIVLFLVVHIAMVCLAGFTAQVRAMITGRGGSRESHR
jgi:thiosulfate reductase cytochrome b subunit